jgi:hypothetical protein
MDHEKLRRTILRVVELLVQQDYKALEALSGGRRLTAAMLQRAVQEYPCELAMPPDDRLDALVNLEEDVIEINGSIPAQYHVDVDLWDAGEGRSDLTLSLHLTDSPGELYSVQIDDLHVM